MQSFSHPLFRCLPWRMTAQLGPVWKLGSRLCQAPPLGDSRMTTWSPGSSDRENMHLRHICLPGFRLTRPYPAPFVFPGRIYRGTYFIKFLMSCKRSRSLIRFRRAWSLEPQGPSGCVTLPRGWQPSPGWCGHPKDRTSALRPPVWPRRSGRRMHKGVGWQKLSQNAHCCCCDPVTET